MCCILTFWIFSCRCTDFVPGKPVPDQHRPTARPEPATDPERHVLNPETEKDPFRCCPVLTRELSGVEHAVLGSGRLVGSGGWDVLGSADLEYPNLLVRDL